MTNKKHHQRIIAVPAEPRDHREYGKKQAEEWGKASGDHRVKINGLEHTRKLFDAIHKSPKPPLAVR
jgi:hypothetical protein